MLEGGIRTDNSRKPPRIHENSVHYNSYTSTQEYSHILLRKINRVTSLHLNVNCIKFTKTIFKIVSADDIVFRIETHRAAS